MRPKCGSSITIENNGCNNGVQLGENHGNVVVNQGATPEEIENIVANTVEKYQQRDSTSGGQKSERKKWFRFDTGNEVRPDELIVCENITAQLEENIARAEVKLPDNKTLYAEYDIEKNQIKNVVGDGFPQEYSIHIPPEILIRNDKPVVLKIDGQNYKVERYILKFGGYLLAAYDVTESKLQSVVAKAPAGMKTHMDCNEKIITFINNECVYLK